MTQTWIFLLKNMSLAHGKKKTNTVLGVKELSGDIDEMLIAYLKGDRNRRSFDLKTLKYSTH